VGFDRLFHAGAGWGRRFFTRGIIVAVDKRKELKLATRNTLVGRSFIMPNFIGFFIFVLIPVCFSLFLCIMNWDGFKTWSFAGIGNFRAIFRDSIFRASMARTFLFSVVCVGATMFASLGLAILLNTDLKGRNFFRSAIFFPYVASTVSIAVVWRLLFMRDGGIINVFLQALGVQSPPGWFVSTKWAIWGCIIVSIWKGMGYYMIVYLAGLQDIPRELHEAASIDGASGAQFFWRITLPMLRPVTFFVVLMLTIGSFKSFDLIFALTEGGPGTATQLISHYIYERAFVFFNYGQTSAAAFILTAIVGIITVIQFKVEKKLAY
jgi:ABC-type sugar transport system permease subunit